MHARKRLRSNIELGDTESEMWNQALQICVKSAINLSLRERSIFNTMKRHIDTQGLDKIYIDIVWPPWTLVYRQVKPIAA